MKFIATALILFVSLPVLAKPHLVRAWTRSTLFAPHLKFRHLHRMSPLLTEKIVIQGNGIDGIKAYDRVTGHFRWGMNLQNGVEGGAVVDGDKVYFGANNGTFYSVDVNSGEVVWKYDLNSESLTYPLVVGPHVYHVAGNNTLYAFDKTSGEPLWIKTNAAKSNMSVRGQTAPVYDTGVLYLGFSDGSFAAINAQNGRQLWSKRIGDDKKFNDVDATAVVTPSCILVASYANALYCLNKTNGQISWRHDYGGFHAVHVADNKIYYPTANGEIHVLDQSSGKLMKKIVGVEGLATKIVSFKNFLVYGESMGAVVLRDKDTLKRVKSFSPGLGLFAHPTVDEKNGEIYFISNDANLFRLDLKDRPSNTFLWSGVQQ